LQVEMHFLAGSLFSYVSMKYSEKSPDADPIMFQIKNSLYPESSGDELIMSKDKFIEKLKDEHKFEPLGEKVSEFEKKELPMFIYKVI
jgi:hypothetical protein